MAPEQFRGEWRKFGPWTDLYALGCLAWELTTGRPPFDAESVVELAMSHLNEAPEAFVPRMPVPARFEPWVRRLLAKDPMDRFRRAADALWALVHDIGAQELRRSTSLPRSRPGMAPAAEPTAARAHPPALDVLPSSGAEYELAPPFPHTWETDHVPARLDGAGLGLLGIREIPFVGRQGAREYVWDRLDEVAESGENEVIVVHGEPGIGRSRFAQWFARRAHELGAAAVVKAYHAPIASRSDGLAGAITRHLEIEGVDRQRAADVVRSRLPVAFDPTLIFQLLYTGHDEESSKTSSFSHPTLRFDAVEHLLQELSRERAVVFIADDVQWSADTLMFIQRLASRRTRTLILATVRSDALADRYWESKLLSEIELGETASTIHLQPLTDAEQIELIGAMLNIDPDLADRVARRAQGIPLFATQLVGDWVQRELLIPGSAGFHLVDESEVNLPDDVYTLWNQRIDELAASLAAPDVRVVLETAALLGRGLRSELEAVCHHLGFSVPPDFERELVSRRFATRGSDGWFFKHGMLRETLERSAEESGRAETIFRAAGHRADPTDPYRLAEFQIRGGEPERAVENLITTLERGMFRTSVDQSEQLLDVAQALLDDLDPAEDDVRRARLAAARVDLERLRGDARSAWDAASELADRAEEMGWKSEGAHARLVLGTLAEVTRADPDAGAPHFEAALALYDEAGDLAGRARTLRELASYRVGLGEYREAVSLLEEAGWIVASLDDPLGSVECSISLGEARLAALDVPGARNAYDEALELAQEHHLGVLVASALDGLGQVAEAAGELDESEALYRQAQEQWTAIGSEMAHVAGVHLALLLLSQKKFHPARQTLIETRELVHAGALPQVAQIVAAGLLACAAIDEEGEFFDELNREIRQLLRKSPTPHAQVPNVAFLAGDLWARIGDRRRARKAYDVARNVFLALGEHAAADDVAAAIGRL